MPGPPRALGRWPGDEYYDYLTESAKRSIFVDSYRREQKMASWAYPALMVELSPVFGWLCDTCRRGYKRSCDLASADFLVPFVAACLCVLTIVLLFFRWRQNVLYWTKKEPDSIAKGMVRTRLKFLNCQQELVVGVVAISLVSYAVANVSYEAAAVICIADAGFLWCALSSGRSSVPGGAGSARSTKESSALSFCLRMTTRSRIAGPNPRAKSRLRAIDHACFCDKR